MFLSLSLPRKRNRKISRLKKDTEEVVQCSTNYHNVQYYRCHSRCSCLNDYDVVTVNISFVSLPPRKLISLFFFSMPLPFLRGGWGGHTNMKCMSIFQSWSHSPWISQAIHRAAQSDPATDSTRREPACTRACVFVDAWIVTSDQSLSMKSCTICKKCKREKKNQHI